MTDPAGLVPWTVLINRGQGCSGSLGTKVFPELDPPTGPWAPRPCLGHSPPFWPWSQTLSGAGSFAFSPVPIQLPREASCGPRPHSQPSHVSLPRRAPPAPAFRGQLPVTCPTLLAASSSAAATARAPPVTSPGPRSPASPSAALETEAPRDWGPAPPRAGPHREGGAGAVAATTSRETSSSGGEGGAGTAETVASGADPRRPLELSVRLLAVWLP